MGVATMTDPMAAVDVDTRVTTLLGLWTSRITTLEA
jgi:hypothetical protein